MLKKYSRLILSAAFSVVLMLFVAVNHSAYLDVEFRYGLLLFILSLAACLVIGAVCWLKLPSREKLRNWISLGAVALLPTVTITLTECLNGIFVYDMYYYAFFAGYILVLLICALVFALSGSIRLSIIIPNVFFFILAMANYYVKLFRGTVLLPIDLASIGTAKNVAGTYDYSLSYNIVISILLLIFIIVVAAKLPTPKMKLPAKLISRAACLVLFSCVALVFFLSDFLAKMDIRPDFWNQSRGYKNNGVSLSFFINLKYIYVRAPSGYNADKVADIVYDYLNDNSGETVPDTADSQDNTADAAAAAEPSDATVTPDIICIMNESFADLSTVGYFTTNIDYMPFYRSLSENTIKGNLYVPVKGSGTSNTEFEFLTGCSMAYYPSGSNAYTLYMKSKMPSLVSTLSSAGYSNLAFHPYYPNGWNRPNVYKYFGFSRYDSIGSVIEPSILNQFNAMGSTRETLINMVNQYYGTGNNILLRQYVSDACDFDYIIKKYEQRDKSNPFFLFNVTMQSHGSYTGSSSNFVEDVYVTGTDKTYRKTNQYLSLIKATDDAFKDLINYYKKVDRPVIICMFGDHQPSIEPAFYEKLLGKSLYSLSTEEDLKLNITPFCIWANYDIDEQYIDKLSSNYLSSLLLKISGVPMSDYNKYLLKMSKTLPVINPGGYIDNRNICYSWAEASPYSKLLKNYEKVQYNYLFDTKNRVDSLFTVS